MNEKFILNKSKEIDKFIANKRYKDAALGSYNVIRLICKTMLSEKKIEIQKNQNLMEVAKQNFQDDYQIIEILKQAIKIIRKYDYDHMDVFNEDDAKVMKTYMMNLYHMI